LCLTSRGVPRWATLGDERIERDIYAEFETRHTISFFSTISETRLSARMNSDSSAGSLVFIYTIQYIFWFFKSPYGTHAFLRLPLSFSLAGFARAHTLCAAVVVVAFRPAGFPRFTRSSTREAFQSRGELFVIIIISKEEDVDKCRWSIDGSLDSLGCDDFEQAPAVRVLAYTTTHNTTLARRQPFQERYAQQKR